MASKCRDRSSTMTISAVLGPPRPTHVGLSQSPRLVKISGGLEIGDWRKCERQKDLISIKNICLCC